MHLFVNFFLEIVTITGTHAYHIKCHCMHQLSSEKWSICNTLYLAIFNLLNKNTNQQHFKKLLCNNYEKYGWFSLQKKAITDADGVFPD